MAVEKEVSGKPGSFFYRNFQKEKGNIFPSSFSL